MTDARESRGLPYLLVLLALLALVAGDASGSEPQVAFALKNGWLEFTLQHDGKPVPDAIVRVFNDQGNQLAEGETGPEGRGSFPLGRGDTFFFEAKIADRNADPITLNRTVEGIGPDRILLSFGLRPCCRIPSRGGVYRAAELEDSSLPISTRFPWIPLTAVLACLLTGGSLLFFAIRSTFRGQP